jgi:hypothetical protein
MNTIINALSAQANELMKSQAVRDMLAECTTDEERCKMLAIASMHSLIKANL